MKKSKRFLSAALAAVMAMSLAACGTSGDAEQTAAEASGNTEAEADAEAGTESGDGVKITCAVWNGDWGDRLERVMANFNKQNPGITLDIQMQTGDYSDFLGAKVAANDLPDMYILTPYKQVEAFAEAGRLMDLSDQPFVERVFPQSLEAAKSGDKVYGYPANYEFLGVFYNKALFEQAGIEKLPTTQSEFKEVCEKLEAAGIQPIASMWKDSWTLKHLFSALMTPIVQDDIPGFIDALDSGEGTFNVEGIDEVFGFADIVKQYSGNNMMDQDSTAGFNALANGQAAMLLSGEFSQSVVGAMTEQPDIGVFAMPVSENAERNKLGVDVGIVYVVNANTEHKDACMKVLEFFSNPDDPEGYIAINTSSMGTAPPAMPYESSFSASYLDDYLKYAEEGNTVPWVYQQYANGFDVISGDIFQGYIAGAKDKETVLKELDENYKNFIE